MKQSWVRKGQGVRLVIGVAVLAAAAAWIPRLAASSRPSSDAQRQQVVEERMRVAESAVLVRPPARRLGGLPRTSYSQSPGEGPGVEVLPQSRMANGELIVYLGDEPLEVTEVQRLDGGEEWSVVIYLDAPLTGADALFHSALALARSAETLTSLGPVELLVADPEVQSRVSPTRFPRVIENSLAEIAMQASRGEIGGDLAAAWRSHVLRRDRTAESDAQHGGAVHELVTRQGAALSRAVRDRCRADTCLLLLVSEGFSEIPSPVEVAEESASSAACCGGESRRLARELAASRWVVGVVTIQSGVEVTGSPRERPPEARQLDAGVPLHEHSRHVATAPSPSSQVISLEKLNLVVRLESEPLKRIARETGGFLAATASELRASLNALDERILVWFRQPADPPEGRLPLRVVFVPRGQDLWAPRWWRAREETRR